MDKTQLWTLVLLIEQLKPTLGYDTITRAEQIAEGEIQPTPDEQKQFDRLNTPV